MALRIRYHEDALADLETVFDWSREKHPKQPSSLPAVFSTTSICCKPSPTWAHELRDIHVYHRVDAERLAIEILHFWHSARRPPKRG
jgi:hypothetical protein